MDVGFPCPRRYPENIAEISAKEFTARFLLGVKSLIHFELLFVCGVRKCSSFIGVGGMHCPLFPAPSTGEMTFTPVYTHPCPLRGLRLESCRRA